HRLRARAEACRASRRAPALKFERRLDRLAGGSDDGPHFFGGRAQRVVEEMRVTRRRVRVAVTQERANQRQARATADELRGVAVAQIVNAQPRDARGLDDLSPT